MKTIETDVFIAGAGPTGLTMAALLAREGVSCIAINKYGSVARTPRAHITNQRCMEVFRDLNIEQKMIDVGTPKEMMGEHVFCYSLAGEEFGRLETWGSEPNKYANLELASPSRLCDIPQDRMEPILQDQAQKLDANIRFHTEYLSHEQDEQGVTTKVQDTLLDETYLVRSKYLIGADGARSKIAEDLKLPFDGEMGRSGGFNIVFRADLSNYFAHRPGIIYMMIQNDGTGVGGVPVGSIRFAEPWDRFVAYWGYDVSKGEPEVTEELSREIITRLVGEPLPDLEIEHMGLWTVNDMYAVENTKGRVFCAGDAVHRHPPLCGLGTNTCIGDAYNLYWKLAMVLKGQAGSGLLDSYQAERVPVARQIVSSANKGQDEIPVTLQKLGLLEPGITPEQRKQQLESRKDDTKEAAALREKIIDAFNMQAYGFGSHGVELNQRYESLAIVSDGTPDPGFERDADMYHQPSSRPGAHMPHAWLVERRTGKRISTLDLCGKGKFSLLTGISGEAAWSEAVALAKAELGIEINLHIIGPGRTYEDSYGYFRQLREVEESGALLVRPDCFVAFRASKASEYSAGKSVESLKTILDIA